MGNTINKFQNMVNGGGHFVLTAASSYADVDAANEIVDAIRKMSLAEQAELWAYARHWVNERIHFP